MLCLLAGILTRSPSQPLTIASALSIGVSLRALRPTISIFAIEAFLDQTVHLSSSRTGKSESFPQTRRRILQAGATEPQHPYGDVRFAKHARKEGKLLRDAKERTSTQGDTADIESWRWSTVERLVSLSLVLTLIVPSPDQSMSDSHRHPSSGLRHKREQEPTSASQQSSPFRSPSASSIPPASTATSRLRPFTLKMSTSHRE